MKKKYKRLQFILMIISLLTVGLWLILKNFNQNIVFFYSPSELMVISNPDQTVRLGGFVEEDSIIKIDNGLTTQFVLTDKTNNMTVKFTGILPNLFRENQGIVAKGRLKDGVFIANELLTKHDENYKPKEFNGSSSQ